LRAAAAGLLIGLVDAGCALLRQGPTGLTTPELLRSTSVALLVVFLAFLAAWIPLALLARRAAHGALCGAVVLGLLVVQLDVAFLRWDAALSDLRWLGASAGLGLLAGGVGYVAFARSGCCAGAGPALARGPLRLLVPLLFLALAVLPWPGRGDGAGGSARPVGGDHSVPRVILIVADTLRADALSCLSDEAPATPALDALAARSHVFTAARAPSGWTLPSVASLLTGVSPLVHGATARTSSLPAGLPTLATRLADAGYRTAAIGHNNVLASASRRLQHGFDEYRFQARQALPARSLGFLVLARHHRATHPEDVEARDLNASARAWIAEHAHEDFFLWLHYYDPHLEYAPPPELQPPGPPPVGAGARTTFEDSKAFRSGLRVPDQAERAWIRSLYEAEVRGLDAEVGRLVTHLEELGLFEDTLLVFTSDHGEEFWEHDGFEHGHTLYEELLRVPLIVKLPGGRAGALVETPVGLENVAPTVLTLCGVEHDATLLDGSSLFAADGTLAPSLRVASGATGHLYDEERLGVRFDGWKYIRSLSTGGEELYDLASDPGELSSLHATATAELAEGRRRADALLADVERRREELGVSAASAELTAEELRDLQRIGYAAEE
jgi:arylsulfatase A-like enzyme